MEKKIDFKEKSYEKWLTTNTSTLPTYLNNDLKSEAIRQWQCNCL